MSKNPPLDVANFLAGAGLGLTLGTNLFIGFMRAESSLIASDAVFVSGGSARSPSRTMGESFEIRYPLVNVRVRWARFEEGSVKVREIFNALRAASILGYLDVSSIQSEPLLLSASTEAKNFWFMSFLLVYQEGA